MNAEHKITESFRRYTFPNDQFITINKPRALSVSDSGTHRITTEEPSRLHIIPPGWLHIEIESEVGKWEI